MKKIKQTKWRDLKSFYDAEIALIKIRDGIKKDVGLSDLDRFCAWKNAEQHMLNYLLEQIILLNAILFNIKEKNKYENRINKK